MTQKLIGRLTAPQLQHHRPVYRRDRRVHRPELEAFEARQMLSLVVWNSHADGDWNTAANWSVVGSSPVVHRLPGPTDDVQVESNSDITVTISSGADSVRSLVATDKLVVSGGSLSVAGNSTVNSLTIGSGGSLGVAANATFAIDNASVIAGTINAPALATVVFAANPVVLNSSAVLGGGGTFDLAGGSLDINGSVTTPSNFELNGGDLYLNGSLTVPAGSTFTWRSGRLDGPGKMIVATGASLILAGADTKVLQGGAVLVNNGTATWGDLGGIFINTGGATIDNYGTWTATSNESIGGGGMIFNNYGTFAKSIGTGSGVGNTTFSSGNFNNFGTVNGGDLIIETSGDQDSGTWYAAPSSSISFDGGSQTLNGGTKLTGGGVYEVGDTSLRIDNNFTVANLFLMPGAYLYGNWALTVTTYLGWLGGTIAGPGAINIAAAATMGVQNAGTVSLYGTINNAGTILWIGPGRIDGTSGAVINNSGTFNIDSDSTTDGIVVNNSGTLNSTSPSGSGTTNFNDMLNNSGTLNLKLGTLLLSSGGSSSSATYNVAAGSLLVFTLSGVEQVSGTFSGSGAGIIDFDRGTMSVAPAGATFNFPAGLFEWTGGTLSTPPGATLTLGGTVALVGSSGETLSGGGTVIIAGTINQTGIGNLYIGGSGTTATTVNIPKGSTYYFAADSGIAQGGGGGGILNNAGAITKSTGVNTSTISSSFNNQGGTLNVQSGTLTLAPVGGASSGGTFNVASGAALNLTGGQTVNYAGNYTGSGAGQVELLSGTLVVVGGSAGATFSFPAGLFQWSGGTINTNNSTLTIAGGKSIALTGFSGESLNGGGTLAVSGTINQSGMGNLFIGGGTTLSIPKGGSYNLQSDSGIAAGASPGGIIVNAGTLSKTVGTNVSTISTLLNNTGTLAVSTGTLNISGAVSQVTGTTLAAGTWNVSSTPMVQSTLTFAAPPLLTTIGVGASVTLSGPHSSFTNLAGLNANAGSFSVTGGLGFTTTGSLANSGTIILAASDVLAVAGSYTQTATGTLSDTIAGTAASGKFGAINATGAASLGGTLAITVPSSFSPTMGDIYPIMAFSSHSGTFATITGLSLPGGLSLVPGYNAKNVTLTVSTSVGGAALAIVAQPGPPSSIALTSNANVPSKMRLASIKQTGEKHPGQARLFRTIPKPAAHSRRALAKRPVDRNRRGRSRRSIRPAAGTGGTVTATSFGAVPPSQMKQALPSARGH